MVAFEEPSQSRKNSVRVLVRVRPLLPQEYAHPVCVGTHEDGFIEVTKDSQSYRSRYESVLPEETTQEAMYTCLRAAVNDAFNGYNATVLAYGQTGTGKTHTMMGSHEIRSASDLAQLSDQHGIIPRAICDMFARAESKGVEAKSVITVICSYMEIYNDHLYDLLQPYKKHLAPRDHQDMHQLKAGLSVKEDGFGQIYVQHLMAVKVTGLDQVFQLIKKGNDQRSMRQTELNQNSSRGHSILQFLLEQRPTHSASNTVTRSKINFVDLAGSERYPADNSTKARLTEMSAINVSLSALASVVSALVAKDKHVPYRDSKLTHLLKDSLGGNCNTYVIATISPSSRSFDENVSTLKFADRASSITNNAVKNVQLDLKNQLEMKDREISRLRAMVIAFAEKQEGGGGDGGELLRTASRLGTAENQVQSLKSQIERLQEALDAERRRAHELESHMRGGTVVDAPDLLDVDSVRRQASLNGEPGTSAPAGASRHVDNSRNFTAAVARAAAPLANDLSMFALGPPPRRQASPAVAELLKGKPNSAQSPIDAGLRDAPGAPLPYLATQKRRPKGRTRNRPTSDGAHTFELQPMLSASPPPGQVPAQLGRAPQGAAKLDPQRTQNRNYQNLLDMYSKLASDVADLNIDMAPGAAKRRKNVLADSADDANMRVHLHGGDFSVPESAMLYARHVQSKDVTDAQGRWGLRNILVSRGASSDIALPVHQPVGSSGLSTGASSAKGSAFGLKSILQNARAKHTDMVAAAAPNDRAVRSHRGSPAKGARRGGKPVSKADVFDAGSWIYILGASASSVKAKQIAASTRLDPHMAQLALKSIDFHDAKRRR